MDQDEGRPFAYIKVGDPMIINLYGLKGNSVDEFNPWRERDGRRTPHKRDAPDGNEEDGGGGPPHYSK